ncbi:MAG: type II toxin-antitoxin system RelE/ParE family toxin [Spirochaetia bacterium]|jgi:mRNA interferase RelE/StbE|nr:type II toxin-antitoxin system RelE/ParE family toxin [Spirochaetia bacterium]
MKIYQSRSFKNKGKKLTIKEKNELDTAIKEIIENPLLGTEKKGDLKDIFIYKFKINSAVYLLSYRIIDNGIELIMLGSHANYYRELKSYLKNK